ncbi:MAG: hypothetical protein RL303_418 [Verrucomicrobiota bacterium]|jgi:hypothetical protein
MNRELERLLKEKWFLVAADLIAVLAILVVMPDKRDGFDTFFIVCAILTASLIVVIPVMRDGGGKAERQAEQARLRAKLAEEIDLQRDNIRAGTEALNRRIEEVESSSRKAAEAAAAAVAQRASAEINALKSALAELNQRVQAAEGAAKSEEALEELAAKVEGLAGTVRELAASSEESVEAAGAARAEAALAAAADLKAVRDELKKSAKQAEKNLGSLEDSLQALRAELSVVRQDVSAVRSAEAPSERPIPASPLAAEKEAPAEDEETLDEVADASSEPVEEDELDLSAEPASPAAESEPSSSSASSGTALIVNLMIGIGNKPFVRGTGPGLSPDKGVPMQFLGIGRWQWISPDPEASVTIEVWKNDQSPMGEPLHISGGEPLEVDEGHFGVG